MYGLHHNNELFLQDSTVTGQHGGSEPLAGSAIAATARAPQNISRSAMQMRGECF
jgi:hypothetical protein